MKCLFPIYEHEVYRFVMPVIESNMYILVDGGEALVIDPCISAEAESMLQDFGAKRCTVLLTHEHYDHISGVNRLRELFECRVICTKLCAENILDPRKNAAAYFNVMFLGRSEHKKEQIEAIIDLNYQCTADEVYEDECYMDWHGLPMYLKALPGHAKGSQIIKVAEKYVFSGDNLIPGKRVITRLPGGDRMAYQTKVRPYLNALPQDAIIYPGHGEPAILSDGVFQIE